MIEGAVAYAECTGKTKFLDIMCRMTDHIYNHFVIEGAEGFSGHPEIELALMRLYRCTGNNKYLELAEHFVNVRGVDKEYFKKEHERNRWTVWSYRPHDNEYTQCQAPVREQTKATGHAVRAVYLYTGMADLAATTNDEALANACRTLWNNVTQCQMYVTGGIGSAYEGEAFTKDYHLPNDTAYAETCASIGLIFFERKMLDIEKNADYADVMERALYNTVLAGMQLDGQRFFYVNPLEALPGISSKAKTHPHTLIERPKWFACACCPPNVARLLPSIADYSWIADTENKTVYSNLFIGGELDLSENFGCKINVTTNYPYENTVSYKFIGNAEIKFAVRIPAWSKATKIFINGDELTYTVENGYAYFNRVFADGDEVIVKHDMSVRYIYCNEKVSEKSSKIAVTRGPLVYCAEGADNDNDVLSLRINENGSAYIGEYKPDKIEGIVEISVDGYRMNGSNSLYSYEKPTEEACKIHLVPYYSWANRGANQMRVWLPKK